MAIATEGTWKNPLGFGNIPDFGLTELFSQPSPQATTFYNPAADPKAVAGPTYYAQQASKGNVLGTSSQISPSSLAGAQTQVWTANNGNGLGSGGSAGSGPSGYGADPNFRYSGWGIDFGTGAQGQAAYEAYRQQQELQPQIDAAYAPQEAYLGQLEGFYKGQLPGYQQEAQSNFDVNKQLAGTAKKSSEDTINTQERQAQRSKEDALAKARRIFNEQMIGSQQRFGGASSAGGAYSELLARNLQSEQGQIGRQAVDVTQQIGVLRQQVQQKFDDTLLQLEQQKQKSMNDIQREFDQKMMEISNNRTQIASAKAQMKLQALMDLRNQTFALQQQDAQFRQALALQKAQADQQVQSYGQTANTAGTQASTLAGNLGQTYGNTQYGLTSSGSKGAGLYQTPQYVGQIGKSVVGKDELGRTLYSDGTAGWTQWQ